MLILRRIATGVTDHFNVRASEWALASILFLWGLQLLQPEVVFGRPSYVGLLALAPEEVWGWGAMVIGGCRLVALVVNGTFATTTYASRSPHVRAAMAFLSCFFWLQITLSITAGNPMATSLAVYPVLLVLDLYNIYRASVDARHSDEAKRNARPGT